MRSHQNAHTPRGLSTGPCVVCLANLGGNVIEHFPKVKAKRVIKTQDLPPSHMKRSPSLRSALWGTWRTKHAKPSTPVVYSGIHYKPT